MKLHLPKSLLVALLSVYAMPMGHALTVNRVEAVTTSTDTYNKNGIVYANGELSGENHSADITFTLNYGAVTDEYIMYVTNGTPNPTTWGFIGETDKDVRGLWNLSVWSSSGTATATTLQDLDGDEDGKVLLTGSITNNGTCLAAGDTATLNATGNLINNDGLKSASAAIVKTVINTTMVETLYFNDNEGDSYMFSSGGRAVVYASDKAVNVTTERLVLTGGDDGSAVTTNATKNPIFVGGAGQLFLQMFNAGSITLDNDIYLAASTHGDVATYGVLRFGNDKGGGATTTLNGKVYILEDTSMKASPNGSDAIKITGLVTDKFAIDGTATNGGKTLTIGGKGYQFSGGVDVSGLILQSGSDVVFNSALTVTQTIQNSGKITLNGVLTATDIINNTSSYEIVTYVNGKEGAGDGVNGYKGYNDAVLISGGGEIKLGDNFSVANMDSYRVEGNKLIASFNEVKVFDTTNFYANSGFVDLSKFSTSASTYHVATGATLDTKGKIFDVDNITVILQESATLKSSANVDTSKKQIKTITLNGDACVDAAAASFGVINSSYNESFLNLNQHVLTKTGSGAFYLVNTTVAKGGLIIVKDGSIQIGHGQNAHVTKTTRAKGTVFELDGGNLQISKGILVADGIRGKGNINATSHTDNSLQLEGHGIYVHTGNVVPAGNPLTLVKNGTGRQVFNGTVILKGLTFNSGELEFGGTTTINGNMTLNKTLINKGSLSIAGDNRVITIGNLDLFRNRLVSVEGVAADENGFATSFSKEYTIIHGGISAGSATVQTADGAFTQAITQGGTVTQTYTGLTTDYVVNNGEVKVSEVADTVTRFHTNSTADYTGTLVIDGNVTDDFTAAQILQTTDGNGDIAVTTYINLTDGAYTQASGKLIIRSGGEIRLGVEGENNGTHNTESINLDSFSGIVLDGGTLSTRCFSGALGDISVLKNSTLFFADINGQESGVAELNKDRNYVETLSIEKDVTLALKTHWKGNIDIQQITGLGNINFSAGANDSTGRTLTIHSVKDYAGKITISERGENPARLNLTIGEGESLSATQIGACNTSTITLSGSGRYNLGSSVYLAASGNAEKGTLSDNWSGTVIMSGTQLSEADLNKYGNAHSTIELSNVSGSLAAGTVVSDLILNGNITDGNDALNITNTAGREMVFTGNVSGGGRWAVKTDRNTTDSITLSGDVSGWTGRFISEGITNLKYTGAATVINHGLLNGGDKTEPVLNVTFENTADVIMNGEINPMSWSKGTVNLTVGTASAAGNVTFNGAIGAYGTVNLAVAQGGSAIITADSKMSIVELENGATLTLGDGITASSSTIGTLIAHSDGNTILLNKGATLNAFTKGTGSGAITLTGSGVYDMGSSSTLNVSGLTDAQNWSGVVKIGYTTISKLNVDTYGNASSYVEFCGTSTWMDNTNTNYLTNLILSKSGDGSLNGLTINASSDNTYNLHGSVSGEGDFIIASSGASDYEYAFKGDLSAWDGKIRVEQSTENSNAPVLDITLSGGGDIFVADGNGGIEVSRGGTVNLNIGNADEVSTLNGAVSHAGKGSLNLAVQGDTVFNADINISQMTLSGTGVDVSLFGAQNTINSPLSITSGNSLTLETGSELSVNNAIQNDGFLDIKGTLNWNITSTAGLTVEYAESELLERTDNGLGKGVIDGLITGEGSLECNGAVTVNGAAGTLDPDTRLVTAGGLVYYVMETPTLGEDSTELYYSLPNGEKLLVNSVVTVGNHDYNGPKPSADVNSAYAFYVGTNGTLCLVGDSDKMSAADILTTTRGDGDLILRAPGYQTEYENVGYKTFVVEIDDKTHLTGDLYFSPYCVETDENNQESIKHQSGAYLILNKGADISSFASVNLCHTYSNIIINGEITKDKESKGHINNLTNSGSGHTFLFINQGANDELILSGDTTLCSYVHIPATNEKQDNGYEQAAYMRLVFNQSAQVTIENLTTGSETLETGYYNILELTSGLGTEYSHAATINGVVNIESFDYRGYIYLNSTVAGSMQVNLNMTTKGQMLYDWQYFRETKVECTQNLTITGEGTYVLSAGNCILSNFGVLSTKVAEDGAHIWQGTVEVNRLEATDSADSGSVYAGINPADYGNADSTVAFNGFKGYLTDDTPEEVAIVQNLVLTNALEEVDGDTKLPAMDAYEISSGVEGQVQNYTGTISGDGDFVVSAPGNMTFNLKGNISGWAAEAEGTETPALIVKAGEHAVNFSDNATVINADLLTTTGGTMNAAISNEAAVTVNGVVSHVAGGTLNMTVDTAQGTTFNNTVDINSFKVSSGSVTFNNEVYLDKLEVSSGSVANVAAGASAGKVEIQSRYTEKGAAVLQNGMVIEGSSVTGGSAQNAAFEYAENGSISNTVLTDVSLSSSLQSLQEKSSISMENIVATNVYLAGDANFISLDKQTAFTWEKSVVEYGRTYNEVTFTTDSFNGMILDMSLAGNITMTVARDVAEWDNAAADALTNVTIMLEGFRVEGMADGQREDGWFEPLTFIYSSPSEAALTADSIMTVEQLLNLDANSYVFVYYEQLAEGLLIHMSNIPEPSTATLSLLALAALASRRRRR